MKINLKTFIDKAVERGLDLGRFKITLEATASRPYQVLSKSTADTIYILRDSTEQAITARNWAMVGLFRRKLSFGSHDIFIHLD